MMNKKTICGEYLASLILKEYFNIDKLFLNEAPDLQDNKNNIGIDVTRAYGEPEEQELSKFLKDVKNGCMRPRVTMVCLSEDYPKQEKLVRDAFIKKVDKKYGFKMSGLFIYSNLEIGGELSEIYNRQVFNELCKINSENNTPYNCVFICNKSENLVLYCDLDKRFYCVVNIELSHFDDKIKKLKIITGQEQSLETFSGEKLIRILGHPDKEIVGSSNISYAWYIDGQQYGPEFSKYITVTYEIKVSKTNECPPDFGLSERTWDFNKLD